VGSERRRFQRIPTQNMVVEQGKVFRTLDLSREGMLLEVDVPPPVGSRLHLDLALGEDIVEAQVQVMRHETQPDGKVAAGVLFDRLTPKAERAIREYLLKKTVKK